MRQCQGGWCEVRDKCAHYFAASIPRIRPANRLCSEGNELPVPFVERDDWKPSQSTVKEWARPEVPAVKSVWDLAR